MWSTEVQNDKYRTIAGILDGNLVTSEWRLVEPKNVGKKNETSSNQQAHAESSAQYEKQLKKGYCNDINSIDDITLFKPMLANDYAKLKKPLSFPVTSQPKLDGIRCIARADGLWSRTGKAHLSIPHIWEALAPIFEVFPNLILDGELYNHDLKDDFNQIVSLVRKSKPTEENLIESARLVQYHVYDLFSDEPFVNRKTSYISIVNRLDVDCIKVVPNSFIESQIDLDYVYARYIADGFEGQMVRLNGPYDNKRSKNLLKRKDFITEEYDVLSVEEGLGNWSGCVKRFKFAEFDAGVRGTQVQMADLLDNKECPTWATVRYFELTPAGVPRFPIVIDYGWGERDD